MMAGLNQGNPFQFQNPDVNLSGMFGQARRGLQGGGYPGGPSFGMAPQLSGQQMAMQNALFGMNSKQNAMNYNLGAMGQDQDYRFNPSPFDFLSTGVAGLGALNAIGNRNLGNKFMSPSNSVSRGAF